MKKIEKYDGTKTYMFPTGVLAPPEVILEQYPAVSVFTHIVETDENGEVMFALQNLSAMRSMYEIDPALSEEDAIAAIEAIINAPPAALGPSIEERMTAALEFIAINGMPDVI